VDLTQLANTLIFKSEKFVISSRKPKPHKIYQLAANEPLATITGSIVILD